MSLFYPITLNCPDCREPVEFQANASINADRRSDFRIAILDGSFQRQACGNCGTSFRLDPELNYLDVGRGQWIAAFPIQRLGEWNALETQVRESFEAAYGQQASSTAREIGGDLTPRLVFGWAALREKIVAEQNMICDVSLELMKLAMIRGMDEVPLSDQTELRLIDVKDEHFEMAWLNSVTERLVERLGVPSDLYREISVGSEEWQPLRDQFSAAFFVDFQRLLIESA